MHKTKNQIYEEIKDLKTKKEFEEEIKIRTVEYDGLFDEDTIALLIIDELGRNKQTTSKIAELKPGLECTVYGEITEINESRSFTRKNGYSGKVVNLGLTDDTGTCKLVLWNEDVELVKNKTIKKGTVVKIINGYVKEGFNGLEVNVGRWGLLEVEPDDMPVFQEMPTSNNNKIKGTLIEVAPTNAYFKDDGEFGFVTKIKIKDKTGIKQLTLWGEKVKDIQKFEEGDMLEIDNISMKQLNKKTELHVNSGSTIKKC